MPPSCLRLRDHRPPHRMLLSFRPPAAGSLAFFAFLFLAGCTDDTVQPPSAAADQETSAAPDTGRSPVPEFRPRVPEDSPDAQPAPPVSLNDVAESTGMVFQFHDDFVEGRFFLPEVMGGGVGWIDLDRDGWLDVCFPNGNYLIPNESQRKSQPRDSLFRSEHQGARFRDIAAEAGVVDTEYGQGCAVADFDGDGFPDLYLANYGRNALFHNNGDGTFTPLNDDVTAGSQRWSTSCAWTDLNHDGFPDLYVVNYMNVHEGNVRPCKYNEIDGYCGPGEYDALPDEAFLNPGNGEFREASAELGLVATDGKGLAIGIADFDNDLRAEIYVANDMTANLLFSERRYGNEPDDAPPFRELAGIAGCGTSESGVNEASMGVALTDFDLDLQPDIYLSHFYHQKNTMYLNSGNLTFRDVSRRFRTSVTSHEFNGFGVVPFDLESDGAPDLFVANGHVLGPLSFPCQMRPQLLANVEGKYVADISEHAGPYFQRATLGRGAAGADYDNDGDTDIAVSHIGHPAALLNNSTPRKAAAIVGLILEDSSRNAPVGGRVEIEQQGYRRTFPVVSGGSYLSSPDPRILIPVPATDDDPATIRIFWTSGGIDEFNDLTPGAYWFLSEGRAPVRLQSFRNVEPPDASLP